MSKAHLQLLQWNCMYSENPVAIADFIATINADVVCLQELTDGFHLPPYTNVGRYLTETLGYFSYYEYGPMALPDGSPSQMGDGIFSRYPLTNIQKIIIQPGAVKDGKITADERFYLKAGIEVAGTVITIGTAHLPFHPRFYSTPLKERATQIILQQAQAADHYIFAGDPNTSPQAKAAKMLRTTLKNAGPGLAQKTWTTKPFIIGPWQYQALQWRLDYVLAKGTVKTDGKILQTELSDHLPILVDLCF